MRGFEKPCVANLVLHLHRASTKMLTVKMKRIRLVKVE